MRRLLFFLICCTAISASGQDLTGIWRGHFKSTGAGNRVLEQLMGEDRYKFEVQLDQRQKAFTGVTYSYKTTVFYGKATCSGAVNTSTKKVILDELKIVEVRMAGGSDACIMTLFLQYSKSGEEEFLEGTYTSINTRDSMNCGRGVVFLRKVPTSDFYKEPFLVTKEKEKERAAKKQAIVKTTPAPTPPRTTAKSSAKTPSTTKPSTDKPAATTKAAVVKKPVPKSTVPPQGTTVQTQRQKAPSLDSIKKVENKPIAITPKVLLNRENELVKTIETSSREITIHLYDNGTIDNDTVSVYLDKKLVVSKQRLTGKPISIKFELDEDNVYHELVMVAENLGEIPPNTSLMVVKAGSKQYEVRITSNEQKNAVVIFKYEKLKT